MISFAPLALSLDFAQAATTAPTLVRWAIATGRASEGDPSLLDYYAHLARIADAAERPVKAALVGASPGERTPG